ncbi:MAG: nucleotide sugar dehydrogenase, partial [Anaerolineales bacterium]
MTRDQEISLPPAAEKLLERFARTDATIGVIGLGYVGLPLAVVLAEAGYHVLGLDADPGKVTAINEGRSYIEDVSTDVLSRHVASGLLEATTDYADLEKVQGISICVPTPLRKTGDPDLSYIVSVAEALKEVLHPELVVVLESTTYPGTTREMVQPALESTGLVVGQDIFLAFSPERVDPGREDYTTVNTPKVIGGITPVCTKVAG